MARPTTWHPPLISWGASALGDHFEPKRNEKFPPLKCVFLRHNTPACDPPREGPANVVSAGSKATSAGEHRSDALGPLRRRQP